MTLRSVLLVTASVAASCGYTTPYRVSPPVSNAGVEMSLVGERCYVNRTAEQFPTTVDDDNLHVDVKLRIANTSSKPAQVALSHFQLTEQSPTKPVVMSPTEGALLTLSPNETRTVGLDFETADALDCRHDFAINATDAVALDGNRVDIAAIHFQPTL